MAPGSSTRRRSWTDNWRGLADFLERQPDGGYEVVDTKLARSAKPAHVLQLCFYTEQLARIQGRWPEAMHVVNGLGERERFRPGDFSPTTVGSESASSAVVAERRGDVPVPGRPLLALRFPSALPASSGRATTISRSSPGSAGRRSTGSSPLRIDDPRGAGRRCRLAGRIPKVRRETLAKLREQADLQLQRRADGRAEARDCSRSRPSAVSRSCPSRRRATSGSTSRAIPGTSRAAGSSTCSAGST